MYYLQNVIIEVLASKGCPARVACPGEGSGGSMAMQPGMQVLQQFCLLTAPTLSWMKETLYQLSQSVQAIASCFDADLFSLVYNHNRAVIHMSHLLLHNHSPLLIISIINPTISQANVFLLGMIERLSLSLHSPAFLQCFYL